MASVPRPAPPGDGPAPRAATPIGGPAGQSPEGLVATYRLISGYTPAGVRPSFNPFEVKLGQTGNVWLSVAPGTAPGRSVLRVTAWRGNDGFAEGELSLVVRGR